MCHCVFFMHIKKIMDRDFPWLTPARNGLNTADPMFDWTSGAERKPTPKSSPERALAKSHFIDSFPGKWREHAGDIIKATHN